MLLNSTAKESLKEEQKENKSAQYSLSLETKREIVDYLSKIVDDCENSRGEWLAIRKECLDLYNQIRQAKSDPWQNCSNITVGVVPMHVNLMHSKLYPAVWSNDRVYWKPTEKGDVDNVEAVRKFMDWVIRQDMKLGDNIDDILLNLVLEGTVALKTRWDRLYRKVKDRSGKYKDVVVSKAVLENVPIDQVYLPSLWKYDSDCPEDEAEYIGQKIHYTLPKLKDLRKRNILNFTDEELNKIIGSVEQTIGATLTAKKSDATGISEYYSHLNSMPIEAFEFCIKYEVDGEYRDNIFIFIKKAGILISAKPLEAVVPTGKRPWVIGQFIRRVGLAYGIGLAELMRGLAKELDAIHNQRIDAGSVSIAPFFFYRAASSTKPEIIQVSPGAGIPVDDINDVRFAQFPSNLAVSFQEERIIIEYIEKITSTSAFQMGRQSDIVRSHATATGTMAIINQGEQAYTVLGMRAQRTMSRVMTNILNLYQCFMPDDMGERVLGKKNELLFPQGLKPEDIAGGYDAYMVLDSTIGNKSIEQQQKAAVVQNFQALMVMKQTKEGYYVAANWLRSIGEINIESILGKEPQEKPMAANVAGAVGAGIQPNLQNSLTSGMGGGLNAK